MFLTMDSAISAAGEESPAPVTLELLRNSIDVVGERLQAALHWGALLRLCSVPTFVPTLGGSRKADEPQSSRNPAPPCWWESWSSQQAAYWVLCEARGLEIREVCTRASAWLESLGEVRERCKPQFLASEMVLVKTYASPVPGELL